jgi:integrase
MARVRPKDRMRSRVLSDSELREVWRAADSMGPFGAFVQLLILTATRRNEAARMRRSELSNGDWLIPASRYKSKKPHLIPLSKAAQELLAKQPQIVDCDYVFALDGARPLNSFGRGKELLDKLSGVTGWTLHDTRRVARSLLSRAGISNDVAEMCLGHSLPTLRRTYDLHGFYREKARAFELLAQEVGRVVNPPPAGKVVRLGSRRRG